MKNLMLYVVEDPKADVEAVLRLLDLQVDNSLRLGWEPSQMLVYTSFPYSRRGVEAVVVEPEARPRTARLTSFHKTTCILRAFERLEDNEHCWYHDVDAFQLEPMVQPPSSKPLSFCLYCTRERLLVQGGSMFFDRRAKPVFERVLDLLAHRRCRKDEFALTDLTGEPEFAGHFEVLDYAYNLGGTDFELRYQVADKPIRVVHFHPERREHIALFLAGINRLGVTPVDENFAELLYEHGFVGSRFDRSDGEQSAARPRYRSTGSLANGLRRVFPTFAG